MSIDDDFYYEDAAPEAPQQNGMQQRAAQAYQQTAAQFQQANQGMTAEQVEAIRRRELAEAAEAGAARALQENNRAQETNQVVNRIMAEVTSEGYGEFIPYIRIEVEAVILENTKPDGTLAIGLEQVINKGRERFYDKIKRLPSADKQGVKTKVAAMDFGTSGGTAHNQTEKTQVWALSDSDFEKDMNRRISDRYQ